MPFIRAYLMTYITIYERGSKMKKIIGSLFIVCCLLITVSGCDHESGSGYEPISDPDAGLEYVPISEIREDYSQIIGELRDAEFENLDFSDADFNFPEIDSISALSLGDFSGKSAQEIYDFFCMSLDTLMPGEFSDEQKMNGIVFTDGERDAEGNPPTINEYKLTDYPFPMFTADDCFMDMQHGSLRWFDNAELMRFCGEEGKPIMQTMASKTRSVKTTITDMNSTEKYELINGEISVKEAAEYVNNYLATMNFSPYELSARKKAVALNVVDIGGGKYGYNFIITPEYKNVLFDYPEMRGGVGIQIIENDYDNRVYVDLPGQIDMIETDKVYHFVCPAYNMSIKETETYTSIITLENAARIVSRFYSPAMKFTVKSVQAVYLPYGYSAIPCWKFSMRCGSLYNTFVNMRTGEVYLYIQG